MQEFPGRPSLGSGPPTPRNPHACICSNAVHSMSTFAVFPLLTFLCCETQGTTPWSPWPLRPLGPHDLDSCEESRQGPCRMPPIWASLTRALGRVGVSARCSSCHGVLDVA